MCDPITIGLAIAGGVAGTAATSLLGGKDNSAEQAAARKAQVDADAALAAQKQAQDQTKAASDSSSEADRVAQEDAMRKLLAAGGFGATLPSNGMGAPTVATRQLYGA